MKIKAIFYDFDGVIKESTQIKTEAFYDLYLPYGIGIAEKVKNHHLLNGGVSRFEKFKHYHKKFLNIELSKIEINELAEQFSKIVFQKVIDSKYVPGALSSIKKLDGKFKQFIVTGTPQDEIELILEALDITQHFKGIFGSPSSKVEISEIILKEEKLKKTEVVFVGDATTDYTAAQYYDFAFILRSHSENYSIFEEVDILKTTDLTNLENMIKSL